MYYLSHHIIIVFATTVGQSSIHSYLYLHLLNYSFHTLNENKNETSRFKMMLIFFFGQIKVDNLPASGFTLPMDPP